MCLISLTRQRDCIILSCGVSSASLGGLPLRCYKQEAALSNHEPKINIPRLSSTPLTQKANHPEPLIHWN